MHRTEGSVRWLLSGAQVLSGELARANREECAPDKWRGVHRTCPVTRPKCPVANPSHGAEESTGQSTGQCCPVALR
jgi:hypothetical protein